MAVFFMAQQIKWSRCEQQEPTPTCTSFRDLGYQICSSIYLFVALSVSFFLLSASSSSSSEDGGKHPLTLPLTEPLPPPTRSRTRTRALETSPSLSCNPYSQTPTTPILRRVMFLQRRPHISPPFTLLTSLPDPTIRASSQRQTPRTISLEPRRPEPRGRSVKGVGVAGQARRCECVVCAAC